MDDELFFSRANELRLVTRICDGCGRALAFTSIAADLALDLATDDDESSEGGDGQNEEPNADAVSVHAFGCHQPAVASLTWYKCAQCPAVDYCAACKGMHAHECVPAPVHAPNEICSNCHLAEPESE
jgi:hypothetical protein